MILQKFQSLHSINRNLNTIESSGVIAATLFVLVLLQSCEPSTVVEVVSTFPDNTAEITHEYGNKEDSTFVKREYYQSGKLRSLIPYVSGKIEGDAFIFFEDSTLAGSYHYDEGVRNGLFRTWHPNGNLKSSWEFKNDTIRSGGNYFENGQLIGELKHNDMGMLTYGKYYHQNGNVRSEGAWKDGNKSGVWNYYEEDGSLKESINYDQ